MNKFLRLLVVLVIIAMLGASYTTNFLSIVHGKPLRVRNICWLATRNWNMEPSCIDSYSRCQY